MNIQIRTYETIPINNLIIKNKISDVLGININIIPMTKLAVKLIMNSLLKLGNLSKVLPIIQLAYAPIANDTSVVTAQATTPYIGNKIIFNMIFIKAIIVDTISKYFGLFFI